MVLIQNYTLFDVLNIYRIFLHENWAHSISTNAVDISKTKMKNIIISECNPKCGCMKIPIKRSEI